MALTSETIYLIQNSSDGRARPTADRTNISCAIFQTSSLSPWSSLMVRLHLRTSPVNTKTHAGYLPMKTSNSSGHWCPGPQKYDTCACNWVTSRSWCDALTSLQPLGFAFELCHVSRTFRFTTDIYLEYWLQTICSFNTLVDQWCSIIWAEALSGNQTH